MKRWLHSYVQAAQPGSYRPLTCLRFDVSRSCVGALRVIVTRPHQEAQHWVAQLRCQGFDAQALPLIDIIGVTSTPQARSLEHYDALMFVSSNAVTHFFKNQPGYLSAEIMSRCLAPGPGTAAALLAAGVPVTQVDAPSADALQFDSEALWQLVGRRHWQGARVLVVRGSNATEATGAAGGTGRDWLAQRWRDTGAIVDFLQVYERRPPHWDKQQLEAAKRASADACVWLFSSSQSVHHLMQASGLQTCSWDRARAVATHPRIAQTLTNAGWGVVTVSRPDLDEIVLALRSIESEIP